MRFFGVILTLATSLLALLDAHCRKSTLWPIGDERVVVETTLDNVSRSDIDRVKKEAIIALDSVSAILEIKYDGIIRIRIVEGDICHTESGMVYLPIRHVQNKTAAIVHEVTHIIARHSENRFFSEGIAVYFQERFGEDNAFPNFEGIPLDDLLNRYKDMLIPITDLATNNQVFRQVGTEERVVAYIEAGSFFSFLVATYGENRLRDLHNSLRLNYSDVYGKTLEELETGWRAYVLRDPS